jgi:endonuclease/exonuclease/phosphatase family metal-dependent hydrolase
VCRVIRGCVCLMRIISWNIKGLGGLVKRKEVRKLVGEKNPSIVCLQETKLPTCDDFLCSSLWGNSSDAFSFRPSVGASGGLLTLWDTIEVEVWSSESRDHVLWCHGRFLSSGEELHVANVYGLCDAGVKQGLWDYLSSRIQSLGEKRVCVCGDFNAVRFLDERRSSRIGSHPQDHIPFSRFIDNTFLVDMLLSGRKFTWYKGDDITMSRLDRFLLSDEWRLSWPNCTQAAQLRGISDHCPLILLANEDNWGPRPLRMLKCWREVPGYQNFVRDKWQTLHIDG